MRACTCVRVTGGIDDQLEEAGMKRSVCQHGGATMKCTWCSMRPVMNTRLREKPDRAARHEGSVARVRLSRGGQSGPQERSSLPCAVSGYPDTTADN